MNASKWLLAPIASVALLLGVLAAPAQAATPKQVTGLRTHSVMKTDFKAAWSKVKGASRYEVQWSTSPRFAGARSRTSSKANAKIQGLKPGRAYVVRVRALAKSSKGWKRGRWSVAATARTFALDRVRGLVRRTGTDNQVWASRSRAMSWTRLAGATGYDVQVSKYSDFRAAGTTTERVKGTSAWARHLAKGVTYKVRVRGVSSAGTGPWAYTQTVSFDDARSLGAMSLSLTPVADGVRASWNAVDYATVYELYSGSTWAEALARAPKRLGAGTRSVVVAGSDADRNRTPYGNPIRVRVQGKGVGGGLRTVQKAALPTPVRPDHAVVNVAKVGSFNVCQTGTNCGSDWSSRDDRVKQQVDDLDAVGLQEILPSSLGALEGSTHDSYGQGQNAVLWRTARFSLVDQGALSLTGGMNAVWVRLQDKQVSGGTTVIVSTHLNETKAEPGSSVREIVTKLAATSDKNGKRLDDGVTPVVLTGDLVADAGHTAAIKAGFYDGAAAGTSIANRQYSTVNKFATTPQQPADSVGFGPRADHVLVKNSPGSDGYRHEAWLRSGRPSSDHNLVWATVGVTKR